jgi:hypothetical protein
MRYLCALEPKAGKKGSGAAPVWKRSITGRLVQPLASGVARVHKFRGRLAELVQLAL